MSFLLLKYIHIFSVAASFALLFIRGIWLLQSYPPAPEKWVKILPHAIDGLLVLTALGMIYVHPPVAGGEWLSYKIGWILVYVALVVYVSRFANRMFLRLAGWLTALLVFLFITSVAVLHNPKGILMLL
jgi:uncharacterized membrane protein SirB2